MDYYFLKSIIGSNKKPIIPDKESKSFYIPKKRKDPYVEPTFNKEYFDSEKPDITLVSAVGATGKSTLAKELSHDLQLPLLDLGEHKPVGGNALTGILTDAYDPSNIGDIFSGIRDGSFGVIIDGVDEGKAKTNDETFRAFLDDVSKHIGKSNHTSIVMLGRTQSLEDCYLHFLGNGDDVGLATINTFSIDSAKTYVDTFTSGANEDHTEKYREARDLIINCISDAFQHEENESRFESFIGYPPVLDSISTALDEESNYVKITNKLEGNKDEEDIEVKTLYKISRYIIDRERNEKIIPQIVKPIVSSKPEDIRQKALEGAYTLRNQSARLVAHCLGENAEVTAIPDPNLQEQYEESLTEWLREHPFLDGNNFRNVVFEAVALAKLMSSDSEYLKKLARRYLRLSKGSYHLVYMMNIMGNNDIIDTSHIPPLVSASLEFRSTRSNVEVRVDGISHEEYDALTNPDTEANVSVNLLDKNSHGLKKEFSFRADIDDTDEIVLHSPVGGLFMTVPCEVALSGSGEIEILAPNEVSSRSLRFDTDSLVARPAPQGSSKSIIFRSRSVNGYLRDISINNAELTFSIEEFEGVHHPLYQYAEQHSPKNFDPNLKNKYIRLRRILREFRSHGKGSLAKYYEKIEHSRVLKNEIGKNILSSLLEDEILFKKDVMYHLDTDKLDTHLGVGWHDFRLGKQPDKLMDYLKKV